MRACVCVCEAVSLLPTAGRANILSYCADGNSLPRQSVCNPTKCKYQNTNSTVHTFTVFFLPLIWLLLPYHLGLCCCYCRYGVEGTDISS